MIRRTNLVVLGLAALAVLISSVAAHAETISGAYVSATITQTGSYAVAVQGTNTLVDVYDIAVKANDPGKTIASFDVRIGPNPADPNAPTMGSSPFQVWYKGNKGSPHTTAFQEDADGWLLPDDFTSQADSHFVAGVNVMLGGVAGAEVNDGSIYPVVNSTYNIGLGWLHGAYGVLGANQVNRQDIASIGVVHGTDVWMNISASNNYAQTDYFGGLQPINSVPEPSALALLGLGMAGVIVRAGRKRK